MGINTQFSVNYIHSVSSHIGDKASIDTNGSGIRRATVSPPVIQSLLHGFNTNQVWQDLHFHQYQKDGEFFVDVINRKTKETLRTFYMWQFQDIFKNFSKAGLIFSHQI